MSAAPEYARTGDQDAAVPVRHAVVVVGAGPVGLTTAIDLARGGVPVVLLDEDGSLATGSRAICFAKRTLEIFDRLGCGDPVVAKGVGWQAGRVFFREALAYRFDLLAETGHERPAFVNLQQYYVERFLLDRAATLPGLDLRWRNTVVGIDAGEGGVRLAIDTPDGPYALLAEYVIAADGARSGVRGLMGLQSEGRVFRDRFLIAEVRMTAGFPNERLFWFDPPFHPGQSVLLHKQPDDIWRIDFQLGWDADPVQERMPERVIPRVQALLGPGAVFDLEWVSVYTFACSRMARFRHGRVLFAGDSAHGVSPFGARGANGGVQDAENLAWKLRLVVHGLAPDALLDSYAAEREFAADENIQHSTRATDFITPKSEVSRLFRDAVLELAREHPFARRLVNSGRLSVPVVLAQSPLNTPDEASFDSTMVPGAAALDAPVGTAGGPGWLLRHLGDAFVVLVFGAAGVVPGAQVLRVQAGDPAALQDTHGLLARRYDGQPGTTYLFRPDQHVCARWRAFDPAKIVAAMARATGHG